jgi:hypothetical protein
MGQLIQKRTGFAAELAAITSVGRAPGSQLLISDRIVSNFHAEIRWTGTCWQVRDLGTKNGTWLDGQRLQHGETRAFRSEATLSFGDPANEWQVADDAPPCVVIKQVPEGPELHLSRAPLPLPDAERVLAMVFADEEGRLVLETEAGSRILRDGDGFEVDGVRYVALVPQVVRSTTYAVKRKARVREIELMVRVSSNEEHVSLDVNIDGTIHALPAQAHNEFIPALAREWLEDRRLGRAPEQLGWLERDELCRRLNESELTLNKWVQRLRERFSALDLADFANIVERRPRELRLGVANIRISKASSDDE